MCLPWSISILMTHNLAQNAFLIYTGFSASNGGHFSVYSTTFLPFFERKFDAYLRRICLFDAYLRRSGGFMCQMTSRHGVIVRPPGESLARSRDAVKCFSKIRAIGGQGSISKVEIDCNYYPTWGLIAGGVSDKRLFIGNGQCPMFSALLMLT